jgi:hypothetical protein
VSILTDPARKLSILDFDFESKPLWFWYEKPTAILTSLSYMSIDGLEPQHDTLQTEIAPLATREEYQAWLLHVRDLFVGADMLTGHNIDRFDLPLLQAQLIRQGLPLLPSMLTQDTMRLPRRRDASVSQESLITYAMLKPTCKIGMPIYKDHLSIPAWEDAALGWNDEVLIERPMSDVHGHAHLRQVLIEKGYLGAPKTWTPRKAR